MKVEAAPGLRSTVKVSLTSDLQIVSQGSWKETVCNSTRLGVPEIVDGNGEVRHVDQIPTPCKSCKLHDVRADRARVEKITTSLPRASHIHHTLLDIKIGQRLILRNKTPILRVTCDNALITFCQRKRRGRRTFVHHIYELSSI
jgi:hypothetical protein